MNTVSEKAHIEALSRGDSKSFEILFLFYQPKLIYFINGFIKDNELARDMAQDVFLKVWHNREVFSQVDSFKSYLFRMARNAICNHYDHSLVDEKFKAEQLFAPVTTDSVEDSIFAAQLQEMIAVTVSLMPPQRKLIYTMSRIEGLSNTEIAEKLNLNKRTVENHLTAALADIRKVIKATLCLLA